MMEYEQKVEWIIRGGDAGLRPPPGGPRKIGLDWTRLEWIGLNWTKKIKKKRVKNATTPANPEAPKITIPNQPQSDEIKEK
jgi:hypothetical protein